MKLYQGDCLEVMKQIPDGSVDCVLTDPPYGIGYCSGRRKIKHKKMGNDERLNWLPDFINELQRISKDDACWYIFCSWHNIDVFKQAIERVRNIKNILVWNKNNHGSGDLFCDYAPKYELIIFCNKRRRLNGKRIPNVLNFAKAKTNIHPTQKPVDLCELLIEKSTNVGDVVLDPFMGSGTTGVACKNLNRKFIGIELDEEYFKTAEKRIKGELK